MHRTVTPTTSARIAAMLAAPLAALTLVGAPAAHADDASYLAKLNASGVPIPQSDAVRLSTGRYICDQLKMYGHTGTYRSGSPAEVVRLLTNVFFYSSEAADAQIDAAETELCPEAQH